MERSSQVPRSDHHSTSSSNRKISETKQQRRRNDYKKKKLENRKNHLKKILEKQDAGRRAFTVKDSEFVGALKFRNTLPDIPFDPKFLHYPTEPERLVKYRPTSMESEYVHQLHLEPHLGLPIDLVDSNNYEVPTSPAVLPKEDADIFHLTDRSESDRKCMSKVRPAVSWLRRTEYMGNDLYDSVHKFQNEIDLQDKMQKRLEQQLSKHVDQTLEDRAIVSFDELPQKIEDFVHPHDKARKPAHVWSIFPDDKLCRNSYATVTYDVLPERDLTGDEKTKRQSQAIVRNVQEKVFPGGLSTLVGSLVVPSAQNATTDPSSSSEEERCLEYYRDYQLDLKKTRQGDQYIFLLDPKSPHATYCELMTRVELKKTMNDSPSQRKQGVTLKRRPFTSAEAAEAQKRMKIAGATDIPEEIVTAIMSDDAKANHCPDDEAPGAGDAR